MLESSPKYLALSLSPISRESSSDIKFPIFMSEILSRVMTDEKYGYDVLLVQNAETISLDN